MTTAGTGRGTSPIIADDGMPRNDFSEFLSDSDELFGAPSPLPVLDFSGDPDSLHHHLDVDGSGGAFKSFLSPQPHHLSLSAGSPNPNAATISAPDSPTGSFRDSQSDGSTSSSKRTASSVSSKTALTAAGDVMMTDGLVKEEWGSAAGHAFMFGVEPNSLYDDPDNDKFMDEAFDFDSASSSPNAAGAESAAMTASPDLLTVRGAPGQPDQRSLGHNKNLSVWFARLSRVGEID